MRIGTLLLILSSLITPLFSHAQSAGMSVGTQFQITTEPAYPAPFSTFTASLNDYSLASAGAVISWRVNGITRPEYQNQRRITLTTGDLGKQITLEASLTPPSGLRLSAKQVIKPIYLDLVVEPQTRVPNFYEGRPLPSVGSTINATALVNAGALTRERLVYRWSLNDSAILEGPVRGQNQVTFTMPQGDAVLGLSVENLDGVIIASKQIELINSLPYLRFYEINSLYGVLRRPLETLTLIGNSTSVRAEPFNLDVRTYNAPDVAEWSSSKVGMSNTGQNPYEITFLREGTGNNGSVNFHVRNMREVLQGAKAGFGVNF